MAVRAIDTLEWNFTVSCAALAEDPFFFNLLLLFVRPWDDRVPDKQLFNYQYFGPAKRQRYGSSNHDFATEEARMGHLFQQSAGRHG